MSSLRDPKSASKESLPVPPIPLVSAGCTSPYLDRPVDQMPFEDLNDLCRDLPPDIVDFTGRRLIIIGMGSIGRASLPILFHSFSNLLPENVFVLSNSLSNQIVCDRFGVKFHLVTLLPENFESILSHYVGANDFVLNVSVSVSSNDMILFCQKRRALYLDTCIEPWPGGYDPALLSPSERSNARQRADCLSLVEEFDPILPPMTAVVACGANPGMISWLTMRALLNLRDDILPDYPTPTNRLEWAKLSQALDVKVIHIAESDSQIPIVPKQKDEFVNTWSVDGFISEGVFQPSELGWGTHEKSLPNLGSFHPRGQIPNAIYINRPGGALPVRSWTPEAGSYLGFLVTHNEAISLSQFLSIPSNDPNNPRGLEYCPTVHYAYQPCDAAVLSLHEMFGNNSKQQSHQRIPLPFEIHSGGVDELGVLIMGHAKGAYWYGSSLSIDRAREIAPYNTATSLQVVAGILAGMVYAIRNPHQGLIEAEQIPLEQALKVAHPLLEPLSGHYSDWTPTADRPVGLVHPSHDETDPWQFKNFLFHPL